MAGLDEHNRPLQDYGIHSTNNPTSIGAGGGAGAGKVNIGNFNIMKKTDAASPLLFLACCRGKHFEKANDN